MTTNAIVEDESETSAGKMQSAFSLKIDREPPQKDTPKYENPEFIEALKDYLNLDSHLNRNAVAKHGDSNFYGYSKNLEDIRDLVGAPSDVKPPISEHHKSEILDIVNTSKATKPLVYLIRALWGLNLANNKPPSTDLGGNPVKKAVGPKNDQRSDLQQDPAISYRKLLISYAETKDPLNSSQMDELITSLSVSTEEAEILSRQYLESMLYIGAGLIFFRFQCSLMEEQDAKILQDRLLSALNSHFRKSTKSALDSIVGRIRRAYLKAMAFHLDIAEPKISDKEALWSVYKESIREIPKLVDRYYHGDLNKHYLKGIPYIPNPRQENEDKGQPKKKPEWAVHIKMLKAMFEAAEPSSLATEPEFDDGFLNSTLYSLEKLTELLETQDTTVLANYNDAIEDQIHRLQSLLKSESE